MLEFFSTAIGRALGDHWILGPNETEYYAEVIAKQGPDFLKNFNPKLLFWVATALIVIPRLYETGVLIVERVKASRATPPAEEPTKGAANAAIEFPEPRGPRGPRQPVDLAKGQGQRSDDQVPEC
jgi:hypothetical protein